MFSLFFTALASVSNACVTEDFAHGGHDILVGGHYNSKPSWEECQKSCQAITECLFWYVNVELYSILHKPK